MNITYEIEFLPDKYQIIMLYKNCRYRHFLYNKCVEILKSLQSSDEQGHIGYDGYELLKYLRDEYESNILYDNRPDWMEDYDYYF